MAFTQTTFAPVGGISSNTPAVYTYTTDDTLSTVIAADYFNDKRFQLEGGDLIYVDATDEANLIVYEGVGLPSSPFSGGGASTPTIVRISGDYTILVGDDYVITDGGNTITLPLFANAERAVFIINEGATNDTIDGNGETVPNGTTLTPSQARGFIPGTSDWREI